MKLYKVVDTKNGVKPYYTGSEGEAKTYRHEITGGSINKKRDFDIVPVELSTDKKGIIAFLNAQPAPITAAAQ